MDGLALHQYRFKGLDAQPMQSGSPVQQHRMLADHLLQDVPDLRHLEFDHALRVLDRGRVAVALELRVDERLEEFERHLLGQAALVQEQFRTDHDHGTPGVVAASATRNRPCCGSHSKDSVRLLAPCGRRSTAVCRKQGETGLASLRWHMMNVGARVHQPLQRLFRIDSPAGRPCRRWRSARRGTGGAAPAGSQAQLSTSTRRCCVDRHERLPPGRSRSPSPPVHLPSLWPPALRGIWTRNSMEVSSGRAGRAPPRPRC